MQRRALAGIAVAMSVAGFGIGMLFGNRAASDAPTGDTAAVPVTRDPVSAFAAPPPAMQSTQSSMHAPPPAIADALPPLPPSSSRLVEQIDALVARVEAGDPVAACRITFQYSRCQHYLQMREFDAALSPGSAAVVRDASNERPSESDAAYCDAIELDAVRDPAAWLAHAEHRLSPAQKTALALLRPDGTLERLPRSFDQIHPQTLITRYVHPQYLSDNAYAFIEAGIAAREPLALEAMLIVHSPSIIPGVERATILSLPDARRYAYYARVMQRIWGTGSIGEFAVSTLQEITPTMPPDALRDLEAAAEQEARRWLAAPLAQIAAPNVQRPDVEQLCAE